MVDGANTESCFADSFPMNEMEESNVSCSDGHLFYHCLSSMRCGDEFGKSGKMSILVR